MDAPLRSIEIGSYISRQGQNEGRPGYFLVSLLLFVAFSALKKLHFTALPFGEICRSIFLCTLICDRKKLYQNEKYKKPHILMSPQEKQGKNPNCKFGA